MTLILFISNNYLTLIIILFGIKATHPYPYSTECKKIIFILISLKYTNKLILICINIYQLIYK